MSKNRVSSFSRRSFLTRSALTVGAVAGLPAFLEACGSTASTSSTGGPSTVTVMYQNNEFLPAYVTQFHKLNPEITINFIEYDATRLSAMFAAGTPPDLVRVTGATDMPGLVARGLVANLDSYVAKSAAFPASDIGDINNVYRFTGNKQGSGSLYGFTKDWSPDSTIWYNKKLFDKAGIPYPSSTVPMSYDELLDLAKRLNGNGIYGLDEFWNLFLQGRFIQLIAQQGGSLFSSDLTKADFTTPEAQKVFQWYVNWAQAKLGNGPLVADQSSIWYTGFPANRIAMSQVGFWFGGEIAPFKMDDPDHVGLAPAPVIGSTRISSCVTATGAYIPANAKNKDGAFKVMEYFLGVTGQPAKDRAGSGSGLPAFKSLFAEIPQAKDYQKQAYATVQAELPYVKTLQFSPYVNDTAASTAIGNAITSAAQGQATVEQAITQLQTNFNLLLQQGADEIG